MSHSHCASNNMAAHFEDSDEESMFYVKRQPTSPLPINNFPINKRLLPTATPWQAKEKQAYVCFLKDHFDLMERPLEERRKLNAYWLMAGSIKSKNYAQCRIHHSRLLRRHASTESIIRACEKELKRGDGSLEKMQQYGLRVEVEEGAGWECCIEESELWTVMEASQRSYYQNQSTP